MVTKYIVKAPCEIVYMQLGMSQEYKGQLIQESYRLKNRKDRENHNSFIDVFNETNQGKVIGSSYKLWEESKTYNELLNKILEVVTNISKLGHEYQITNTWLGVYKKEQISNPHAHEPNHKSFCYYISAEEPYTPMVFNDVGIEIEAVTDRLIIFPSFIRHSVPPCRGGERIMIAGNIDPIL
jgi:hypothetical protein